VTGPYGELLDTRLRVLSWNLWWRFGPWEQRFPAIQETIRRLDPDVCALQEVWGDADGTTSASRLADALGYEHVFATRIEMAPGVAFGNAVLSRWPIASSEHWPLPASRPDAEEQRTVLVADVDGPRGRLQVWCTHLNWRFDHSDVRQDQVRYICERIAARKPRTFPPILCGDMNAPPDSTEMMMLTGRTTTPVPKLVFHDAWEVAGPAGDPGVTWSNDNPYAGLDLEPARRIDYVYVGWPRAGGAGHITAVEVVGRDAIDGVVPSDHYGVLAEIRY
jgi:endonuclease/exonuclease/phosphatase family metal-dependent hydrolase